MSGIKTISIVLPGTIRSKKNSRETRYAKTRHGKLIKFMGASQGYREWEARARQAAGIQLSEIGITTPLENDIKLEVKAYIKGPMLDLDAIHTAVMDALQGIAWVNDRQVRKYSEESGIFRDKLYPRTEITVEVL